MTLPESKVRNFMRYFIQTMMMVVTLINIVSLPHQIAFADSSGRRVTGQAAMPDTTQEYKIVNQNSGLVLSGDSQAAGGAVVQGVDNEKAYNLWTFIPGTTKSGDNCYKIQNVSSGEVLGISNASKDSGTAVVQWADNGTDDHLWLLSQQADGYDKIINKNSGLVLEILGDSNSSGIRAIQSDANGPSDAWKLVVAGNSYPNTGIVSGDTTVHDPSMIKTTSGTYYVFNTGLNIGMLSSTDRIQFSNVGTAFTTLPSWTNTYNGGNGDAWAPDISYHNSKYWLYYTVSTFGSQNSAIGLATSTTAAPGSWTDQGIVLTSNSSDTYNAIDPCLIVDASGKWWLSFGSFWDGIYMVQIDPSTGKQLSSNTTYYHLAKRLVTANGLEASYIYQYGSYYYLFASIDTCCTANATYHIIVGRSTSITGPYTDKAGLSMLTGGGTIILSTHGNVVGPGGESVMTDTDGTLIDYHYYNANTDGTPTLGINLIGWDAAGWPFIH
jgi:arabinan endo-1,5-alpha-L-arabinosidase